MEKFKIIQIGANVGNTDNDPLFSKLMESKSASILIEPNPKAFELLKKNYASIPNIAFEQVIISDFEGDSILYVDNYENGSGCSQHASMHKNICVEKLHHPPETLTEVPCKSTTLNKIFEKYKIDYPIDELYIDTEGNDTAIILSIDFNKCKFNFIYFEHLHSSQDQLIAAINYLQDNGYVFSKQTLEDLIFVNNDFLFQKYYDLQKNEAGTISGAWVDQMVSAFGEFLSDKEKNSKILDIGCGHGSGMLEMNKLGYNNITGVDLIHEKLEYAKNLGLNVKQMDMHQLQLSENEFDYSFMSHVIEHSVDPVRVICEMIRVTKNIGFIIAPIEEPNGNSENSPHTYPFRSQEDWHYVLKKVTEKTGINFNSVFKNTKDGRLGEEIWTTFTKNK